MTEVIFMRPCKRSISDAKLDSEGSSWDRTQIKTVGIPRIGVSIVGTS